MNKWTELSITGGVGLAAAILGFVGAQLTTGQQADLNDNQYVERINTLEHQRTAQLADIESLRVSLASAEKTLSELQAQVGDLSASDPVDELTFLGEQLEDLRSKVEELSSRPLAGAEAPDIAELAATLVRDHAEALRGPAGEPGADGARSDTQVPTAEEIAALVVSRYGDQLRGAPGRDGADGKSVDMTKLLDGMKEQIAAAVSQMQRSQAAVAPTTPPAPALTYVKSGACLPIQDGNPAMTGITFESGALLCAGEVPRYTLKCADINPASCMVELSNIAGKRVASFNLSSTGSFVLQDIGNYSFYFTGHTSDEQPRKIFGGVSQQ